MTNPTGIGASILRKEDGRFLCGRGTYVGDIERYAMDEMSEIKLLVINYS